MSDDAVVISQVADVFSRTPGNRFPFKPDYRITVPGERWPRQNGSRAEARRIARREAKRLGLPVVEIGFR